MNLYLISQDVNNGYETYDSAVVAAESKEEARMTHPNDDAAWDGMDSNWSSWCSADDVEVELIGTAIKGIEKGVILASFNAG